MAKGAGQEGLQEGLLKGCTRGRWRKRRKGKGYMDESVRLLYQESFVESTVIRTADQQPVFAAGIALLLLLLDCTLFSLEQMRD